MKQNTTHLQHWSHYAELWAAERDRSRSHQASNATIKQWSMWRMRHAQAMRVCPYWTFIFLRPAAVQLTCAICLDCPDGRLQQLLGRDCMLPCVSWNLCQSLSVSSVEDFRCVLHYCNTGTHIFIQYQWHTGLLFTLTINHSLHGPLKVSFSFAVGVRLLSQSTFKRCNKV